jgi:hypothetical protein
MFVSVRTKSWLANKLAFIRGANFVPFVSKKVDNLLELRRI